MEKNNKLTIIPVMLCFFAMGFVDLVGTASNYVKSDLGLNDVQANIFPSLVFFWFLIFSVPTGVLMNKIGRKKTVLLSLVITFISLLLPLFGESYVLMLIAFSLLGIGNPLVSTVIKGGNLASTLTFGQFIKAIASFLVPYLAAWGATATLPNFGLGWRVLFPIYMVVGIIATLLLLGTPIEEETVIVENQLPARNVMDEYIACFKLLGIPIVLLSFMGIMCHVGIDVGINTTAPKILQEKLHLPLNDAIQSTSFYFLFRTLGCLTGSIILRFLKTRTFFIISVAMMALSMVGLYFGTSEWMLYTSIALVGYGNSNVFSMVFAQALQGVPTKKNEVSGLMIMGLFGGTIFPLIMGFASVRMGQSGAILVMAIGVIYLFTYIKRLIPVPSSESEK